MSYITKKIGMGREAHFVSARFERVGDERKWCDELLYAILKDEFDKTRGEEK